MNAENTTLNFGLDFSIFFPVSDVFSTNYGRMPLALIESKDSSTLFQFKHSFLSWNYDILEASEFSETQFLVVSQKPEIILLDCVSYQETIIKLRILRENKNSRNIPIIVFSDCDESIKEGGILDAGADDFLLKPINFRKLETLIKRNTGRNTSFGGIL